MRKRAWGTSSRCGHASRLQRSLWWPLVSAWSRRTPYRHSFSPPLMLASISARSYHDYGALVRSSSVPCSHLSLRFPAPCLLLCCAKLRLCAKQSVCCRPLVVSLGLGQSQMLLASRPSSKSLNCTGSTQNRMRSRTTRSTEWTSTSTPATGSALHASLVSVEHMLMSALLCSCGPMMLDILFKVKDEQDSSFSFRRSCRCVFSTRIVQGECSWLHVGAHDMSFVPFSTHEVCVSVGLSARQQASATQSAQVISRHPDTNMFTIIADWIRDAERAFAAHVP